MHFGLPIHIFQISIVKMSNIAYTVLWLETTIKILHFDYIERKTKSVITVKKDQTDN